MLRAYTHLRIAQPLLSGQLNRSRPVNKVSDKTIPLTKKTLFEKGVMALLNCKFPVSIMAVVCVAIIRFHQIVDLKGAR